MPRSVAQRPRISILMYHQIGRFLSPRSHRAVYCDIDRFKAQMAYLRYSGHQVISMRAAYEGLFLGASLPARPVVLTFDDGYENFREYAWPVLQKYGYPAMVYLVSNLVGRTASWFEEGRHAILMDRPVIRQLLKEGVDFGSHTCSHCRLSQCTEQQKRLEIVDSKAKLEDLLGEEVTAFCYPYGDYDPCSRDLVKEAGYSHALTCIRGIANTAENPFEIPRKAISYGDNLFGFFWKLDVKHARKDKSCHNPSHIIHGCDLDTEEY